MQLGVVASSDRRSSQRDIVASYTHSSALLFRPTPNLRIRPDARFFPFLFQITINELPNVWLLGVGKAEMEGMLALLSPQENEHGMVRLGESGRMIGRLCACCVVTRR